MKAVAKPIKNIKETRMGSRKKEYLGLCSLCKTASVCTYMKDFRRPVLQCEEFEEYGPRPAGPNVKNILLTGDPNLRFNIEEKYSGQYNGLCSICEGRKTCTYPKPEGGVWHCEEYQ